MENPNKLAHVFSERKLATKKKEINILLLVAVVLSLSSFLFHFYYS